MFFTEQRKFLCLIVSLIKILCFVCFRLLALSSRESRPHISKRSLARHAVGLHRHIPSHEGIINTFTKLILDKHQ